ncbi:GGDEF domain-containing protein [Aureimonas sp. AU22]|uniref:GGDEF domain-containing protein n=1 Tax=Aureimonas sp. AU22 TaxID=1638162 RepID=UPI0007852DA4|nr:GGDEF domain-containing protein [Aureimonas sp. AU22]
MGEGFAWSVPLIMIAFGVLFLAARRAGAAPESRLWGIGFLLSALAFAVPALEGVLPIQLVALSADTLFAVSFFCFARSIVTRYQTPALPRVRAALLVIGIAAPAYAVLVLVDLPSELFASDITCALQLGFALATVRRWPKRWIDRGLLAISWGVVIENLGRTASVPLTVAGAPPSAFLGTEYSQLMYMNGLLTGLGFAVLALLAVMSDVVDGHRKDALIDPLTGLLNRRGLEAVAALAPARRSDGVIVCDLDHFKQVNDTWGHHVGDRVLIAFAELMRAAVETVGVASRTGGEEFVLYLTASTPRRTRAVAENLRLAMSRFDWPSTGIDGAQTASFGVTIRAPAEPLEDALRRADRSVYEAKRNGRDRIEDDAADRTAASIHA